MNSHVNRITKMAPDSVNNLNGSVAWLNTMAPHRKPVKPLFKVGDHVRMTADRIRLSYKQQQGTFSREVFKIHAVDVSLYPEVYSLIDLHNEPIKGYFYRQELVKTTVPSIYQCHVLKRRTYRGKRQLFVKWLGFNKTEWIDESQTV